MYGSDELDAPLRSHEMSNVLSQSMNLDVCSDHGGDNAAISLSRADKVACINLQQGICNANYELMACTINYPGRHDDRMVFRSSGFHKVLDVLPEGFYIIGDAAYPASDTLLIPSPALGQTYPTAKTRRTSTYRSVGQPSSRQLAQ